MDSSLLEKIKFSTIDANLFSDTAREMAEIMARDYRSNKPTQLRRFYDEIVMWDTRINGQSNPEKSDAIFKKSLPFIRMMNAKIAYAKGRKLVNDDYLELLNHCLKEVKDPQSMGYFKLFMEAFMGFYKLEETKQAINER